MIIMMTNNNSDSNDTDISSALDYFFKPDYVIIFLYVIVLMTSLVANSLLIIIVIKFQYIKSVTNIFLVNLSLADLLVTMFCMPVQISKSITLIWYFSDHMCKVVNFLQGVAVSSSIFTITAMSVDRYLAITQSLSRPWMPSRRGAVFLIVTIWLISFTIFSPLISIAMVETVILNNTSISDETKKLQYYEIKFCTEIWPDTIKQELYGTLIFILVYALPGMTVVASYTMMGRRLCSVMLPDNFEGYGGNRVQRQRIIKERRRVALILLLLAVLFAICWLPYNLMQFLSDIDAIDVNIIASIMPYSLLIGHANSAINPIVYCLMTRNFRRSLRKLICRNINEGSPTTNLQMQSLQRKYNMSLQTRTTETQRSISRQNQNRNNTDSDKIRLKGYKNDIIV